ncbi:MAG: 4-hydroxy-2-oxoheptanedioate aldolase [Chloroflexia bacterium]|jgi:4-hydroxy-2-oxoheptanedioate aldolase|nr:4-hydroxy-2-oxoheptanedioate aldolase [Chloroflexia bacterium]
MRENALKSRLRNGEAVYGLLSPNYDAGIVEMLGHLGFDFYMLDCEHGAGGPQQAEQVIRACEGMGMTPLARIRSADPKLVLQFMDVGIMGVMMPSVNTADDVRRLVEAVKYPPLGRRGIAAVRANNYLLAGMPQEEYLAFANEQTLILPQIETMEAVNNLDSLVQVEGVDGFIVGPRDLSLSMGFRDGPIHPEVRAMVDSLFGAVRAAGLVVGTTAATGEDAKSLVDRGASIILASILGLLKTGAGTFFKATKGN